MKRATGVLLASLIASLAPAEEFSDISEAEINEKLYVESAAVPLLVASANAVGVGVFTGDCSTTNVSFVDVQVQGWWTPSPGTNAVRLHKVKGLPDQWVFPTNTPVVFFAITKEQWYGDYADRCLTSAVERAELTFGNVDRSWFRVTRDNGLLYSFTTNLWECVRANPNRTNYYGVLRDAQRTVSKQESWRVQFDARTGLSMLFDNATEAFLAGKLTDPLLSPAMKGSLRAVLYDKFGWRYVDGVITPPQ